MTHRMNVRVYYEDTDMAGIVYYANYLRFLERGRSEAVRSVGVDQLAMRDDAGIVFVVHRVEIDYLSPARLDDVLTIETDTRDVGAATVLMPQRVLCGDRKVAQARVSIATMSLEGKVARMPADLKTRLDVLASRCPPIAAAQ